MDDTALNNVGNILLHPSVCFARKKFKEKSRWISTQSDKKEGDKKMAGLGMQFAAHVHRGMKSFIPKLNYS